MLLEDCDRSQTPVRVREPHFRVFEEFRNASYAKRYEVFCRKLVRERHYTSTAFLLSRQDEERPGNHTEPARDVCFRDMAASLAGHISAYCASRGLSE